MKTTKFFNIHKELGAKIVDFAGYKMPIQYSSIIGEHKAVRESVGVFDVSHMGEFFIKGNDALNFVQYVTVNDASKLFPGRVQYSAMCYEDGGIVDDLLVYRLAEDEFMLVVNASNIEKDFEWIIKNNKFDLDIKNESDEYSLLAVQGPRSLDVMKKVLNNNLGLEYYHFTNTKISDVDVLISRTGYTGEMGFEIYFKGSEVDAKKVWDAIFLAGQEYDIQPAGLASRDSLRLEMGFCLYGNDIDETTNPLEAGLGWITKLNKESFIGKEALLKQKENGVKRRLVAMESNEKTFPRKGYPITFEDEKIGEITSGTVSPVLEKPIALGYVSKDHSAVGSEVNFLIRERQVPAIVVRLPFVKK